MKLLLLVLCLAIVAVSGFQRVAQNANGVVRSFTIVKEPPAFPNTFEIRAIRANIKKIEVMQLIYFLVLLGFHVLLFDISIEIVIAEKHY